MQISITTPDRVVIDNRQIDGVYVKSDLGPTAILDHHASLITTAKLGTLRVVAGQETDTFVIRNAVLQMDNKANTLTIEALSCDATAESTQLDLSNYLRHLEEMLASNEINHDSLQYQFLAGEKIAVERKIKK